MAELDLNYDPPWMHQAPADSNKPMSLAEAYQLRQRQQQIDSEKALLPLRMQEMQAQISNQALDHTLKQEQVDYALKVKANSATIWNQISQTKWNDPESVGKVYQKFAETGVVDPNAMKVVQANVQVSSAAQRQADLLQNRLDIESMKSPRDVDTVKAADEMDQQADNADVAGDFTRGERLRKSAELLRGSLRGQVTATQVAAKKDIAAAQIGSREKIAQDQIVAHQARVDTAVDARKDIAERNIQARHELEILKEADALKGKDVSESKFVNGRIDSYVKKTRVDHKTAALALQALYRELFPQQAQQQSTPGTASDPLGLLKQ